MAPVECGDPKRIKKLLIDIEKRAEMNPSRSLEEVTQLVIQGLSMKHEAIDGIPSWYFTMCLLTILKRCTVDDCIEGIDDPDCGDDDEMLSY